MKASTLLPSTAAATRLPRNWPWRTALYLAACGLLAAHGLGAAPGPTTEALDQARADISHYRTQRISSADGLAQSSVYALLQDSQGFVWLGCQDGLQRYDGYRFESYRPDPFNAESLSHGMVQALLEDAAGDLWVGTFGGLDQLDAESDQFLGHGPSTGPRWNITALAEDDRGFIWAGTLGAGLIKLPPDRLSPVIFDTRSRPALPSDQVQALHLGPDGSLWVGFKDAGLVRLSAEGDVESIFSGSSPGARSVRSMTSDRSGRLWVGLEGSGLARIDAPGQPPIFFRHDPNNPKSLSHDHVEVLLADSSDRLWVGTRAGLDLWQEDVDGFGHFKHRAEDPNSLANNHVRALMEDQSGLIWVGSAIGGVTIINTRSRFTTVRSRFDGTGQVVDNSLPSNVVRAFLQDRRGHLWVATDGGGVVKKSPESDRFEVPTRLGGAELGGPFPEARVWSIFEDRDDRLWIGGDDALYRTAADGTAEGQLEVFRHKPGSPETLGPGSIRSMVQDEAGRVWIALFGGGLSRQSRGEERFEHYRHDSDHPFNLVSDLTLFLFKDQRSQLWIGTADGLSRRTADGRFHTYRHDPSDRTSLLGDIVRHIYQDRLGNLWVGTDAGLNRLPADRVLAPPVTSTNNRGFTHFTEADGLPNNTVYGILEDRNGRLWLSTNRGLSRFDPSTQQFANFDLHDGLQDLEFNGASALRAADGRLYFGGVRGYNVFLPEEIRQNPFKPPVVFTRIATLGGRVDHEGPIWRAREVTIPYGEPFVSFEFAALDYTHSPSNLYSYRLEGVDDQWRDLGTKSSLTLTHLDPGEYVLHIRGSSGDGIWNDEGQSVAFKIQSPPWLSPTARFSYAVLALMLLAGVLRYRKGRVEEQDRVTQRIRASERRMNLALLGSGDGVWDWDIASGEIYRSHLAEMLGYDNKDLPVGKDLLEMIVHPDDLARVERTMDAQLRGRGGDRFELEYRMRDRSGQWRWILDRGNTVERDEDGRAVRLAGTFKDMTAQKQLESELRLWSTVFESVDEGVAVLDAEGLIKVVNPAFCQMMGWSNEDLAGRPIDLLEPEKNPSQNRRIRHAIATRGSWEGEIRFSRAENDELILWMSFKSVLDSRRRVSHFVLVGSDITQRKAAEEELLYLANYDVLTDLPNRSFFQQKLEAALENADKQGSRLALIFGDLDQFKQVNDTLGHGVGDLLLQEAAQRLLGSVRHNDVVARLGGDEFIVLIEGAAELESVVRVAERILDAFHPPFFFEGQDLAVSTSLGISLFPNDGLDAQSLLKHADTAMYEAKAGGRNQYSFYDQEMSARALARMSLDNRLRRAHQNEELTLFFQPKLDLDSGVVNGVEAMVRWPQPDGRVLTPGDFLTVAEETGLILPIGLWIVRRACEQYVEWAGQDLDLEMSVNISPTLLLQEDFVQVLKQILTETGMRSSRLTLELTEEIVMDMSEERQRQLADLKALEVRLSLDDFGTGYSSLGQLRDMPIDELKIDGSFVRAISEDQAAVPRTILAMAGGLGLEVVAEGVETEEQLEVLRGEGCQRVQGYVISVPLAADELEVYLRSPDPPWKALAKPRRRRPKRRKLRAVE